MAAKNAQTNQGGSVVSFLVVGLVLVAMAGGGIFLLQQRTDQNSPEVAKQPSPSLSIAPISSVSPTVSPAPTPPVTNRPTPGKSVAPPQSSPTTTIPATGPSDLMLAGIAAAILIGVVAAYVQSLKTHRQILNR